MKDKNARERLDALEGLSLIIKHCPNCKHDTIQQRGGICQTIQGNPHFRPDPFGASLDFGLGETSWELGFKCLVCGDAYKA